VKQLSDILLAFIFLVALSPILLLIVLIILLVEFKTPFFIQERIGQHKKEFRIIKFRTMLDGKITFLGKILRKTGIDELPQMINILKGDMSFVGPRPLTKADIERLDWDKEYYKERWELKPGIVGLAQLSPICHKKMSWYLDKYYIKEHSFALDMKILTSSFLIPIVGKAQMKKWMHNR
jgi:lipopolysaccharide/colanic/teichoic acid biosynthesis glycosyltransferase